MKRQAAVADRFYPGDETTLKQTVQTLLDQHNPRQIENCYAVVSPHAGYVYSGSVCAETLKSVKIPETVVILGPNHHGRGAPVSLSLREWEMPMGDVAIDQEFGALVKDCIADVRVDEIAHQFEHSLEVQVPFLQSLQNDLQIVPIALGNLSYSMCRNIADGLAAAMKKYDSPVLIVASSDMNHYESRQNGSAKDKLALEELKTLSPSGLYETVKSKNISMCGVIPVTIALLTSLQFGANKAEIVRYTDSGDVSGDVEQVVGYAGAVIYQE